MKKRLRIAVVADPYLPVPPPLYGGIERVIDFLVEGLQDRGHEVKLWAHPESTAECETIPYGSPPHTGAAHRGKELWQLSSTLYSRRHEFDVIHSFGRLAAVLPMTRTVPVIQTYQREITPRSIDWGARIAGGMIRFTACSTSCRMPVSGAGRWATVYNGVRMRDYAFQPAVYAEAPLVFLGRIERIKGAHTAIEVARRAGRRLVIAGNVPDEENHRTYFEHEIEPYVDGDRVTYVGPVNDHQKDQLLGTAAALLMPIEWEEPFGIVMAEAMACGTPVIGTRRGAVPEVVDHGVTGFVCDSVEELVAAVGRVSEIDRMAVRARCEEHFSDEAVVSGYESLYYAHLDSVR